jgi:nicotinamide mononucleotide (NMN) deamidase PncC
MASQVQSALQLIYALKRVQCVISLTGGGGSAIGEILGTCGASSTLLEVIVPYARQSLVDFLKIPGHKVDKLGYSSREVSMLMANKSLEKCRRLVPIEQVSTCIGT